MSNDSPASAAPRKKKKRGASMLLKGLLTLILLAALGFFLMPGATEVFSAGTTFRAVRAPMEITVLEGGSIEAAESVEYRSQVEGSTKILSIVDEGIFVTREDVENGLVLVELDATELKDELIEERLENQNALATLTEAREEYDIQLNQNESDIKAAELEVKFGRMDLEKFLGASLAEEILAMVETDDLMLADTPSASSEAEPERGVVPASDVETAEEEMGSEEAADDAAADAAAAMTSTFVERPQINFAQYADPAKLGDGEARQQIRTLENEYVLAEEELGLARTQLEGTQRLFEKSFVTQNDLDNDAMKLKRSEISLEAAETSRELFIYYEFPKQAEQLLSDYEEALRGLQRAHKTAISKLAQAEAKLNSAEARFNVQTRQIREIEEQIENCIIRATQPGLVVYGDGEDNRWRNDDPIQEGSEIRERQVIITIPDTTRMTVKVSVHESFVKQVEAGQAARISVDAFPDRPLQGTVKSIAVLPDSQNRWMNPDLKVYETVVMIDGQHDWLKPGMSSEAEIIIDTIDSAIQVPLQAIQTENGQQVVYVASGGEYVRQPVETGMANDTMIEIKSGINPGDVVMLRMPQRADDDEGEEGEGGKGEEEEEDDEGGEAITDPDPVADADSSTESRA